VISPVGEISYRNEMFKVRDGGVGELSRKLYDEILGIQYGEKKDPFGWMRQLDV
jgi:branched-chain amino acid aminotransferase